MTFPQKLQSERIRLNLTQVQAASLLGISASALGKWETGTKTPKLLTQEGALARLAKAKTDNLRAWSAKMLPLEEGHEIGAGNPVMDECPHAHPFKYCETCKVSPCPVGLGDKTI